MRKQLMLDDAKRVLKENDLGGWTRPAPGLYPHQWLWDSCFIAIGLSRYKPKRAVKELKALARGQWKNGMLPHMIFNPESSSISGPNIWQSHVSPFAPRHIQTSGITQPPVLAEAVKRVGEQLKRPERHKFYNQMYPVLLGYHSWLYRERDPHDEGLVVLIHPWETGLDNTPPWIKEMRHNATPLWIMAVKRLRIYRLLDLFRQDTRLVPASERINTSISLVLFHVQRRLRRKRYDSLEILRRSHFSINDVFFNSILIRNNHILAEIADEINETLPVNLRRAIKLSQKNLEQLWCNEDNTYYARNFVTKEWIRSPYIGSLMPLYSGAISKKRARRLVAKLENNLEYATKFPVPTVPVSSPDFHHLRYWQGPTWINTNWLIIDGLRQYGYFELAEKIRQRSLDLFDAHGSREYFSPLDGEPSGAMNFSWTAALIIDLLEQK